jgi:surfactin synthase thioesterase subunit
MSEWFVESDSSYEEPFNLFCFPSAGSSASQFKNWPSHFKNFVKIFSCQLPGREERFNEPLIRVFSELINAIVNELPSLINNKPYGIIGHSLGALIGYELICHLLKSGNNRPKFFMICAKEPPHCHSIPTAKEVSSDRWIIDRLKAYQAMPEEVLKMKEFKDIFLPIMRADYQLLTTYDDSSHLSIDLPILTCHGKMDTSISKKNMMAWKKYTCAHYEFREFQGGHFFLKDQEKVFLDYVEKTINDFS